jgi:predicted metal-dependent phosphoesterase TrpH
MSVTGTPLRKADLHVHTLFSNFGNLRFLGARDSYNDPLRVYERCREIGCDYVAFTDHDTIDGALDLLSRRPDLEPRIIIGEEVTTRFVETGQWAHVNVLGVDEATHADLQRARADIRELVSYLRSRNLVHFLNHPLQSYRLQKRPLQFVEDVVELFTHLEVRNGALPPDQNRAASSILEHGRGMGLARFGVGGSDAHCMRQLGSVVTVAPGDDKRTWLAAVAEGRGAVAGHERGLPDLVAAAYGIVGSYYRHLGSREGMRRMTPMNYLTAAGFVPICLAGAPLGICLLSYLGTSGFARIVSRSLRRADSRAPIESCAAPASQEDI